MKKNKKKKAANKKPTLLGGAAKTLKKLNKNSVGRLSTTQKVVAGATLGALGIRYLVKQLGQKKAAAPASPSSDTKPTVADDAAMAEYNLTSLEEEAGV